MTADEVFDDIVDDLAGRGVSAGKMFGARAIMLDGKAICCLKRAEFGVKLGAGSAAHEKALALPEAVLFDPAGKGRPFKDWVALPASQSEHWPTLAQAAVQAAH
ncbi:hypothetical protein GCM10009765_37880 [Fodinicola feengrottensis]|uniref:TfoX N-terminal domain-containing protein n=1 Tax=Fodinicola feengrottensis TaxID=435914 RepID=A0ABN2HB76_9ACTN